MAIVERSVSPFRWQVKGFGNERSVDGSPWKSGQYAQERRCGTVICAKKGQSPAGSSEFRGQQKQWCDLDTMYNGLPDGAKEQLKQVAGEYNKNNDTSLSAYSLWMKWGLKHELDNLFLDLLDCEMHTTINRTRYGTLRLKAYFSDGEESFRDNRRFIPSWRR